MKSKQFRTSPKDGFFSEFGSIGTCDCFKGLFVDVGNNYSVLDNPNICFVYEYVGSKDSDREQSQYVSRPARHAPPSFPLSEPVFPEGPDSLSGTVVGQ